MGCEIILDSSLWFELQILRILKRKLVQVDCNELLAQLIGEVGPADTAPISVETVSSHDISDVSTYL